MDNPMMDAVKEVDRTFLLIFIVAAALFLLIAVLLIFVLVRFSPFDSGSPKSMSCFDPAGGGIEGQTGNLGNIPSGPRCLPRT